MFNQPTLDIKKQQGRRNDDDFGFHVWLFCCCFDSERCRLLCVYLSTRKKQVGTKPVASLLEAVLNFQRGETTLHYCHCCGLLRFHSNLNRSNFLLIFLEFFFSNAVTKVTSYNKDGFLC